MLVECRLFAAEGHSQEFDDRRILSIPRAAMRLLLICVLILSVLHTYPLNITSDSSSVNAGNHLLLRFRQEYQKFRDLVLEALADPPDVFLLQMLGEELEGYRSLVAEVEFHIFEHWFDFINILLESTGYIQWFRTFHSSEWAPAHAP